MNRALALAAGLASWGLAPAALAAPCGPGDALITEVMSGPDSDQFDEWVELYSEGGCELSSCELRYSKPGDPGFSEKVADVDPVGAGPIALDPGGYVVLAGRTSSSETDGLQLRWLYPDDSEVEPAAWYRSSTVRLSTVDAGQLGLYCGGDLIDEVFPDFGRFSSGETAHCDAGDALFEGGGCTEVLRDDALSSALNDDLARWCVPPPEVTVVLERTFSSGDTDLTPSAYTVYATPGRAGGCLVRDWPQSPRDVLITELHPLPANDAPEFLEIHNPTDAPIDVAGCDLVVVDPEDGDEAYRSTLSAGAGELVLEPGGVVVLSDGACLDGLDAPCPGGEVVYDGPTLTNTTPRTVILECPDPADGVTLVEIHRAPYDPDAQELVEGQTLMLDPDTFDDGPPTGDEGAQVRYCKAGLSSCYDERFEGLCNSGSPGEIVACPTRDWPTEPLDVRITEIMAAPALGSEYIELHNRSDARVDVAGCQLVTYEGSPSLGFVRDRTTLIRGAVGLPIEPGGTLVLLEDAGYCRPDDDDGDTAVPDGEECPVEGPDYSGLSFPNTAPVGEDGLSIVLTLTLECPDPDDRTGPNTTIDQAYVAPNIQGLPRGHSAMRKPATLADPTPDDPLVAFGSWCAAGFSNCFDEDPTDDDCDAGTPGEVAPCPTVEWPEASLPCRCTTPTGLPPLWLVGLMSGTLLMRRRRP